MEPIVEPVWQGMAVTLAALVPGFMLILWFRRQQRERTNSILPGLPKGPGHSLQIRLGKIDNRINDYLVVLAAMPVAVVLWTLGPILAKGGSPGLGNYLQLAIYLAILLPFPTVMFFRRFHERARCRLELDTMVAVGRELNLIMPQGFHVFHDFEDEGHRVDHVVMGPSGIYAVTSMGRPRPEKGGVGVDAKVLYTGEALYFPDNAKETEAIARAREQAEYLAGWLSSEVDERVLVEPVLALPGWFVERRKADDLLLLSGQNQHYARILKGPDVFEEDLFDWIVKLLDKKCRESG